MGLEDSIKEIQSVWMEAIHRGEELTEDEINHILAIQKRAISEQFEDDGLETEEELEAEFMANRGIDIFGDKT